LRKNSRVYIYMLNNGIFQQAKQFCWKIWLVAINNKGATSRATITIAQSTKKLSHLLSPSILLIEFNIKLVQNLWFTNHYLRIFLICLFSHYYILILPRILSNVLTFLTMSRFPLKHWPMLEISNLVKNLNPIQWFISMPCSWRKT